MRSSNTWRCPLVRLRSLVILIGCLVITCLSELRADVSGQSAVRTPETKTLTAEAASKTLERDWLYQAMGERLLARSAQEIAWTRQLAARLVRLQPALDYSAELSELDALGKRLEDLRGAAVVTAEPSPPAAVPNWIWYPEGDSTQNAPAAARFFRCRFDLPVGVSSAVLRVAADDACEVYVNGQRVGAHDTWSRAAVMSVGPLLRERGNVLAVRAENRPAPSANPAGFIARLALTLPDGAQRIVVSDGSWRAEKELRPQWEQVAYDDASWTQAAVSAPWGGGPWGKIAGLGSDVQDDPVAAYAYETPAVKELYFSVRQV
jgi:hypothetical protein